MAFPTGWQKWLNQTVNIAPLSSLDSEGMPVYGANAPTSCRIESEKKIVRDREGQEVISSTQIMVAGTVSVGTSDRITLADNSVPPIIDIVLVVAPDGSTIAKVIYT